MDANNEPTIAALATPQGSGGVGIVRLSGTKVTDIACQVLGHVPEPRKAEYLPFLNHDKTPIDVGLALFFPGPHSFTGEDVLELHGHGGAIVMDCLLNRVLEAGAVMAAPGEFSERAFLNNKMDLVQAEAVASLIEAKTEQAAKAAIRSLQGEFSQQVDALLAQLIGLRLYVEAAIDFPEEEIDFLSDGHIQKNLNTLIQTNQTLLDSAKQGALLSEGVKAVIIGRPNAGKSSLMNYLAKVDAAIVTDVPGTTRDVLKQSIRLNGLLVEVVDTAGLRETGDVVEKEGIRRAWKEVESASLAIIVIDGSETKETNPFVLFPEWMASLKHCKILVVYNKIDKLNEMPQVLESERYTLVSLSIKERRGCDALVDNLCRLAGFSAGEDGGFIARRRHVVALEKTLNHIIKGQTALEALRAGELLAEELTLAQKMLSEVTGEFSSDDLLGKIFSEFCIGK